MRVFVTGGGRGFVGGHVVRALEAAGYDVAREFVDVRGREGLARASRRVEAVCHVAAIYSFTAPASEIAAVNVEGTANVIDACRAATFSRWRVGGAASAIGGLDVSPSEAFALIAHAAGRRPRVWNCPTAPRCCSRGSGS